MPRGPANQLPVMGLHRTSGQARVVISGREHYLGLWGSAQAQARYDALISNFLAKGRNAVDTALPMSVEELGDLFVDWARGYYVKAAKPTSTAAHIELTLSLLFRAGHTAMAPSAFRPAHLIAFQQWMAQDPERRWSRTTINKRISHVVEMFRWAVEKEYVPESVWRSLTAVRHLRKGRPVEGAALPPREPRAVLPVSHAHVEAAIQHMQPMLAAMVQVQLLTGMRPGALCAMRPRDLRRTTSPKVLAYLVSPEAYKLDHVEGEAGDEGRAVYIGPKARAVLEPMLADLSPDDFVFSPARSEAARAKARRAARKTPLPRKKKTRRAEWSSRAVAGDRYITTSYRRAITRACLAAKIPAWSPNQLRHSAATYIADHEALDVAQVVLGHRSIKTTLRYAPVREKKAIAAAKRRG